MFNISKTISGLTNFVERYQSKNLLIFINSNLYSTSSQQLENESDIENNNNKQKSLRVAVIGVPNAGKSTFINNLINHRVCPTSSKVHTTRRSNKAIYTEKNTQIVLFDTPGLVTKSEIKKYNLESTFATSYHDSIKNSDLIAVVHDVSNTWTRQQLHSTVLETLSSYPKLPSFLVLNKIDLLKSKRILLDLVKILTNDSVSKTKKGFVNKGQIDDKANPNKNKKIDGWNNFFNIFMVSSLTGDGLTEIMRMLLHEAKNEKWQFPAETYTDVNFEDIIMESVRARLLDYLPQEIPYRLKVILEYFNNEKKTLYASVQVNCPNPRLERLVCGGGDGKLKQITERVTSDLVETFNKPISLTITTHIKKSTRAAVN